MNDFITSFKKKNIKITPQRVGVYKEIVNNYNHPSALDIYTSLRKKLPNISYDTVNRALALFLKHNLIKSIERNTGPRRFDPITLNHSHFYCLKCLKIIDFKEIEVKVKKPKGVKKIINKKILLEGFCDKCK